MEFTFEWLWKNIKEIAFLLLIVFVVRTVIFGLYQVPSGSMETTMLVGERFLGDKLTYYFRSPQRGEIVAFNKPTFNYSKNPVVNWLQNYVFINLFGYELGPDNFTKRVIGIPHDHIKGVLENEKPVIYLNGKKLDEPYLNKYPLIRIYNTDPLLAKSGRLRGRDAEAYVSYDPTIAWKDQPFYRINPLRIVRPMDIRRPGEPLLDQRYQYELEMKKAMGQDEDIKLDESKVKDVFEITLGDNEYWMMGDNRLGSSDCRDWGIPVNGKLIHGKIIFRIWSCDSNEGWWIVDLIKHPIDFWTRMRWSRFFQIMH
ncbi:MAG: Signal peptidase I [candidate division TM6 bacterium GW2011_GWF2_32_72]|nr:MAG: Signal peptidase I [candidate division TM6 bacterium GW2011_GWF2_32_72]